MTCYTLGISAFYHDSACALLQDGEIVAAAQEERFSRLKGDERYPKAAIEYCLRAAGIGLSDLDQAVFYEKPEIKLDRLLATFSEHGRSAWPAFQQAFPAWAGGKINIKQTLAEQLGPHFNGDLRYCEHHESHAASAFYPSPFQKAAVLTMDAVGEWATTSIGVGDGNHLELLEETRFPHSLGMLYSAFTYYTGFKVNSGEYKMMGLAPYGEPVFVDQIRDHLVEIHDDGSICLNQAYFNYCQGRTMTSSLFHELFDGPPRRPESPITRKERDLAASIQAVTEEVVLATARHAQKLTGHQSLALAGGVALNCVANGRLTREGPFENLWIQPASGDSGGALGAAYIGWHRHKNKPRQVSKPDAQRGSYLGPSYTDEDIRLFLDGEGASYSTFEREADLLEEVAAIIDQGGAVGWFHGRMEFGPRALGARSIIGDPRCRDMQQVMNLKIKFRESFRPFAPCVLKEHASSIFKMGEAEESPYMLKVAPLRAGLRLPLSEKDRDQLQDDDLCVRASVPLTSLPAITHVDYSARVQTVDAQRHGRFHRLMQAFYERTGCAVVVNTSFNIRGEPIVCSPRDAYHCFLATDMDCLVLENQVLRKTEQPQSSVNAEHYRARYELD